MFPRDGGLRVLCPSAEPADDGQVGAALAASYVGIKAPELFLRNTIVKRKRSLERAFPNTLDLLLICAESGMSIEHAVRKVGQEIGIESVAMAEEMGLLAAEMAYLSERRIAFDNLSARTGLESVRSLTTVLSQAERYGTPLGSGLRVLSQESRDQRMTAAEKKAAALPPALTVPMILFFLPGLFAAILSPAMIQINGWS
jgi:tight adherence protein C